MIYIGIISLSTVLYLFSEKCKSKPLRLLLVIISLLITTVFAGIRSYETGTDIKTYVLYHFDIAKHGSLLDYINAKGTDSIIYSMMIVFVSHIFPNAHWMLFFIQLYINIFFYIAAHKYNKYSQKSGALFLFVYYCTFYIYTFNIMRQGMAISMLVLGCIELIYKRKYKFYLFMNLMAFLMHPTAAICLIIPVLMKLFCNSKKLSKKGVMISILILVCAVIVVFQFQNIIQTLITVGIVKKRYLNIITTLLKERIDFEKYKLVFCILILLLVSGIKKVEFKLIKEITVIFLMISFSAYLVGGVSTFTERIGLYFWMPALCISSGYITQDSVKIKCGMFDVSTLVYTFLMLAMCVYQFFICNQAAAYPYMLM